MYMNLRQAAEYLGYKPITLRIWKCKHPEKMPPYTVISGRGTNHETLRFSKEDLDQWINEQNR